MEIKEELHKVNLGLPPDPNENILTKDLIEKLTRIYESTNSIIENGFPVDLKD